MSRAPAVTVLVAVALVIGAAWFVSRRAPQPNAPAIGGQPRESETPAPRSSQPHGRPQLPEREPPSEPRPSSEVPEQATEPLGEPSEEPGMDPGTPAELAERATHALATREYLTAIDLADRCLAIDPDNRDCLASRRTGLLRTGDFQTVRPLVEDCLAADPKDLDCQAGMVTIHLWAKEVEQAQALAAKIQQQAPDSAQSHVAQGMLADQRGDNQAAYDHFDAACQLHDHYGCQRVLRMRGPPPE